MVSQNNVSNKSHYISTNKVLIPTKLDRVMTYLEGLLSIMLPNPLVKWFLQDYVENQNQYMSTNTVSMATKLG